MAILEKLFEVVVGGILEGVLLAIPGKIYRWCKVKGRLGTRIKNEKLNKK